MRRIVHPAGHRSPALLLTALFLGAAPAAGQQAPGQRQLEPLSYTLTVSQPASHLVGVELAVPAAGQDQVELMLPVWSPGFYRVEDYAGKVLDLSARSPDGTPLAVEHPRPNRWTVRTGSRPLILVSYQVDCEQRSVTTNWVGDSLAVLNGAPTFITLAEKAHRPHDVRLVLPAGWTAMTALPPAADSQALHYRAGDYDTLVDSPMLAGFLSVHQFVVDGSVHYLVDAGETGGWDGARAAGDLSRIVAATARMWGGLPYRRYYFLNLFRRGGGGLEHGASSLLTSNAARVATPAGYHGWLEFVSHEYFHAFNVKRLRPVELGPFDYEQPPRTGALWMAEGFTSYYGNLALPRAGIGDAAAYLASLSSAIRDLQREPGRRLQTVEQSSLGVWGNSLSGVNPDSTTVSYYVKGEVIAFLLDARVRHATDGARSLDDVMRLANERYSGARGFREAEFARTAGDVAGVDLGDWFRRATASTEELDYGEALEWFGLRFGSAGDPAAAWALEVNPDASPAQRQHLTEWLTGSRP
jgi:predicted metalloprotease with PDZ domain